MDRQNEKSSASSFLWDWSLSLCRKPFTWSTARDAPIAALMSHLIQIYWYHFYSTYCKRPLNLVCNTPEGQLHGVVNEVQWSLMWINQPHWISPIIQYLIYLFSQYSYAILQCKPICDIITQLCTWRDNLPFLMICVIHLHKSTTAENSIYMDMKKDTTLWSQCTVCGKLPCKVIILGNISAMFPSPLQSKQRNKSNSHYLPNIST